MLVTAVAIGVGSCIVGLFLSYYAAAASGATIVLVATVAFFVLFAAGRRSRGALYSA
jgi:ABC-type Mn2+/Zn2+ transport system permease subunit